MRIIIAAFLGGIVLFFWGFVSHMFLPLGEMGLEMPANEDAVLVALTENLPKEGYYFIPGISAEQYSDPAALAAYGEKSKANPNAIVFFQPVGRDGSDMTLQLATEFATNVVSALLAAWLLSLAAFGFGRRVAMATVLGLFAWVAIAVPQWNWYRFPDAMVLGSLGMTLIGWFLAGIAIAWVLGRKVRRHHSI
jgi:hypothetical protein